MWRSCTNSVCSAPGRFSSSAKESTTIDYAIFAENGDVQNINAIFNGLSALIGTILLPTVAYLTLKLKAVKNETAAIHAMVNGAMLANLRELAAAYRKVAVRSGLPEDIAVADVADKKVEAYIQAMVEAATVAAKSA